MLRPVGRLIAGLFRAAGSVLSRVDHALDAFRKDAVSTVIVNSLLWAAGIVAALSLLAVNWPSLRMGWAGVLSASGQFAPAQKLVDELEREGYPEGAVLRARLDIAERLAQAGEADQALSLLSQLPDGEKTRSIAQRVNYAKADSLYDAGDYSGASSLFYLLADYEDGALRYTDCCCALAVKAYLNGDEATARQLLLGAENAAERMEGVAEDVTGSRAAAEALMAGGLFSAENLAEMEQTMAELSALRENMPAGLIAAGDAHTAGLKPDGTVLAAGDNTYGQCDTGGWTDVIQLAAGARHTAGLKSDGTVLAAGDNTYGQCDTGGWTDIIQIAATAYDTLGLKSDGTVISCGLHDYKSLADWHGVTMIAGGSYAAAALTDQGTMLCTHPGGRMDAGATLYDLSVCGPCSAGILYDGTLVSSFEGAPAWSGMAQITVCPTGLIGITSDGAVRSFFFRDSDDPLISVPGQAIEAESGGRHYVILMSDGRVCAFGDNESGQCDVSGWQLKVNNNLNK